MVPHRPPCFVIQYTTLVIAISCKYTPGCRNTESRAKLSGSAWACWPLQDNLLLLVVCARINRPFLLPARLHCPHCCNTIARLLGNIRPPTRPLCVFHTPYTIGNGNIVYRPTTQLVAEIENREPDQERPLERVGLYKIFVCLFGDCALVNTIFGIEHLLYCNHPPRCKLQSILRDIWFPTAPPVLSFSIQHW